MTHVSKKLEPIFSSDDININRKMPVESKRYATMDRTWRTIIMLAVAKEKRLLHLKCFVQYVY